MTGKGIAAAFLAADHGVVLHHGGGDIFKADTGIDHRDVVELAKFVEHGGGAERFDNRAALPPDLQ